MSLIRQYQQIFARRAFSSGSKFLQKQAVVELNSNLFKRSAIDDQGHNDLKIKQDGDISEFDQTKVGPNSDRVYKTSTGTDLNVANPFAIGTSTTSITSQRLKIAAAEAASAFTQVNKKTSDTLASAPFEMNFTPKISTFNIDSNPTTPTENFDSAMKSGRKQ